MIPRSSAVRGTWVSYVRIYPLGKYKSVVAFTRVNRVMPINLRVVTAVIILFMGTKFDSCVWREMHQFIK